MLTMTRPWLILAGGILILTLVDGGYLVALSSYSANEYAYSNSKTDYEQESTDGPVLSVLINALSSFENFILEHETLLIVISTIAIAGFTGTLWRATTGLFRMAEKQAVDMEKSLKIADDSARAARESADAAVKATMPILFPLITDGSRLLPAESTPIQSRHVPTFRFTLENYGKTPAIIIELKYELLLMIGYPSSQLWEHSTVREDREVISGETRFRPGELARVILYTFHRPITEEEITGLRNDPTPENPNLLRFFFYGQIIYDDVFGYRHIKGFGRKVFPAVARQIPSQPVRGGEAFEYYRRIDRRTGKEG